MNAPGVELTTLTSDQKRVRNGLDLLTRRRNSLASFRELTGGPMLAEGLVSKGYAYLDIDGYGVECILITVAGVKALIHLEGHKIGHGQV